MRKEKAIKAYKKAQTIVKELIGYSPKNYSIAFFLDESIYESVLLQSHYAGSPNSILSSNEVTILKELDDEKLIPKGVDLFFPSKPGKSYMPASRIDLNESVLIAKFVYLLAMSALAERSQSYYPKYLQEIFKLDRIIKNLFSNNVFELIKERNAVWAWQYFQDFSATLRLLARYQLADFYVPPGTIKTKSVFYNFLVEIRNITKKRAEIERKTPLFDFTIYGFGNLILNKYLDSLQEKQKEKLLPSLKDNLGQAFGEIGASFLKWHQELEENEGKEILEIASALTDDYQLVKKWNRGETKKRLEILREKLSESASIWHSYKEGYWADLWPVRGIAFDRASTIIGKMQRRKFTKALDLLEDKPTVKSHGRVIMPKREVAIFSVDEDTIGQEQILIFRNHLSANKGEFLTPLPGLPDVIIFKKYSGMHIASYVGINESEGYPRSPYDLKPITRSVQVTKAKNAYTSVERDEGGRLDSEIDYSNLKRLTEHQRRAINYLLRQKEVSL